MLKNKNKNKFTGVPGIDYPAYAIIPKTSFNCSEQRYKGFFGDPEVGCQVWHYCDLNGGQASFLCPNGTIFSQVSAILLLCHGMNAYCTVHSDICNLFHLFNRMQVTKHVLTFNNRCC